MNTTKDVDILPIVHDVRYAIRDSSANEGLVTVAIPSPGAAVTIVQPLKEVLDQLKEALKVFPGEDKEAMTRRKEKIKVDAQIK